MAVRCPNCGNTNDERSKFCNSCGQKLDAEVRGLCPECGAANPPSRIFCDKCGARLSSAVPSADDETEDGPVRALSLPHKDPAEEEDDTPDWLAQLRSGFGEGTDRGEASPGMDEETLLSNASSLLESGEFPDDWGESAPAETPGGRESVFAASDKQEDEIPDWLRDALSGFDGGPTESAAPPDTTGPALEIEEAESDAGELPDWLTAVAPAKGPSAPDQVEGLPPQPAVPEAGPPATIPPAGELESGELPDWLLGLNTEIQDPDVDEPETRAGAGEDAAPEPDEIPDWIEEFEPSPDVPDVEAPAPEPVATDAELMDWLQEVGSAETVLDDGAADLPAPEDEGQIQADDLPDWLREASAAKTVQEEEAETTLEAGELPDWLQQLRPPEKAPVEAQALETVAAIEEPESDESLDWLQELGETEAAPEEAPASEPLMADPRALQTGDLPDWLQAIGPPEEAEEPEISPPAPIEVATDQVEAEPSPVEAAPQEHEAKPETIDTGELRPLQDDRRRRPIESAGAPARLEPAEQEPADSLPAFGEEDEGLPDWLQEFALEDESGTPGLAPPAPLMPDQQPATAQPPASSPPPRAPKPSPAEASALTDWLGQTAPLAAGGELDPTRALGGTGPLLPPELPEWLAAVDDAPGSELPRWLDQDDDAGTLLAEKPAHKEEPATAALPSWLTEEDAGPEVAKKVSPQAQEPLAASELPDWLNLAPVAGQATAAADPFSEDAFPADGLDATDALLDEDGAPFSGRSAPIDFGLAQQLGLVQAEIPDWLQALKPQEAPATAPAEPAAVETLEPVETGGFLDGVRGALKAQTDITVLPADQALPGFAPTKQHQAHARVLEQIVHAGPAPMPDITQERRAQAWLERLVIPLLILAAVLFPFAAGLFPEFGNPLQSILGEGASSEQVSATFDSLEAVTASGQALVIAAFDYSPAEAGELDSIAAAVLRHMMSHGARILAVSTTPTGSEIAQNVLERLAADYDYTYGEEYVNLGYIPGGAPGLKAFAADPWGLFSSGDYPGRVNPASAAPAAAGLGPMLENSQVLLILTADQTDLVSWIEQVGRADATQGVQMVAGVSARLEPWAQAYYQSASGQLDGLVSGIPGGAQYEQRVNQQATVGQTEDAITLRDSQAMGMGIIILLITIGLLWGAGQGLVNRRRADG